MWYGKIVNSQMNFISMSNESMVGASKKAMFELKLSYLNNSYSSDVKFKSISYVCAGVSGLRF